MPIGLMVDTGIKGVSSLNKGRSRDKHSIKDVVKFILSFDRRKKERKLFIALVQTSITIKNRHIVCCSKLKAKGYCFLSAQLPYTG